MLEVPRNAVHIPRMWYYFTSEQYKEGQIQTDILTFTPECKGTLEYSARNMTINRGL